MRHKVERAIIMAAGLGSRMRPVTDEIPKPLISVNGKQIICTVIDALIKNGINDISVVIGYKKEAFDALKLLYPNIVLIENPYYKNYNNISSLYCIREKLDKDCIILDGDQIIYNPNILTPYFNLSGYCATWTDSPTNEWVLQEENGIVTSCSRTGGNKGWQLYSISRWSEHDAKLLRKYVVEEFHNANNKNLYWDDIPMFLHSTSFKLGITPITNDDIIEIDCIEELIILDDSYKKYINESVD
ncbi:phosphocholine cytidylyltransferase family protein [Pseudobutyrivibrio xylanivorans]|uniref:CTP:phosphocholine cytidylyltransferase n=1 Tax=Pseudobutyrivibrio xylanivorans TaxID=185007 RepID=A0A1G5S4W4_PSEXY|nr:phosphocholine cytidylyltransferase family protein [Pseudobutyrivibrio xylanivorans]SCZ81197.1 CTP:phosphocholine cytidylyltransferase [Pseudobutyrivibrio xylanivorans]